MKLVDLMLLAHSNDYELHVTDIKTQSGTINRKTYDPLTSEVHFVSSTSKYRKGDAYVLMPGKVGARHSYRVYINVKREDVVTWL